MARRHFDTAIWDKDWFLALSPREKSVVWLIFSKADNVGVWEPSIMQIRAFIDPEFDEDALSVFRKKLNGNIVVLEDGKWWWPDWIWFHHRDLVNNPRGEDNNALRSYIQAMRKHGIYEQLLEMVEGPSGGPKGAQKGAQGKERQGKVRQGKEKMRHEKTGKLVGVTRYQSLVDSYGQETVDRYIEKAANYVEAKGKKDYADYAAAAANYMQNDGVKPPQKKVSAYRPRFVGVGDE